MAYCSFLAFTVRYHVSFKVPCDGSFLEVGTANKT